MLAIENSGARSRALLLIRVTQSVLYDTGTTCNQLLIVLAALDMYHVGPFMR